MIKGTRVMLGEEARVFSQTLETLRQVMLSEDFQEVIIPSLWEQKTFVDKAGPEIIDQMYAFKDKKGRDICLIPEVTAVIQELYKSGWDKSLKKPVKVFYISRCYRYERPQEGRYREFYQFGVEILGDSSGKDNLWARELLLKCLSNFDLDFKMNSSVKRGLDYYTEEGFEVECANLGAQKQIAGGGRYDCGIGFAIGIDRLILSEKRKKQGIKC